MKSLVLGFGDAQTQLDIQLVKRGQWSEPPLHFSASMGLEGPSLLPSLSPDPLSCPSHPPSAESTTCEISN